MREPSRFTPPDPNYAARVRESFDRQRIMVTLNAQLTEVSPGKVVIEMPFNAEHTQQHGFLHAGITTALVDSACGFAALSLMEAEVAVLAVEFKVNFAAPAVGEWFVATGEVRKPGRTIFICTGEVMARQGSQTKLVALMQATMMTVRDREGLRG